MTTPARAIRACRLRHHRRPRGGGRPVLTAPEPIPDWISVSANRIGVTTDAGRISYSRSKVETFKYEPGWELWFFTLDSTFYGKGFGELIGLATTGDRIDPDRANIAYMAHEFWTNRMWRHGDVAWAIFETILMAFLGTMTAAIIALPLVVPCGAELHAPGIFRVRCGASSTSSAGGRADLDDCPVPRLRAGADDRGHRYRDHRRRQLWQDFLRGT